MLAYFDVCKSRRERTHLAPARAVVSAPPFQTPRQPLHLEIWPDPSSPPCHRLHTRSRRNRQSSSNQIAPSSASCSPHCGRDSPRPQPRTVRTPGEGTFPTTCQNVPRILRTGTTVETGVCTVGAPPARPLWDGRESVQMSCVGPSTLRVPAQP